MQATRTPLLSSLRWRLSAAISGVVALCVAVCVVVAVIFLRQALTMRAELDLQRTLAGVSGYMTSQGDDLQGAAELVAADPAVAAAAKSGDKQALLDRPGLLYTSLNVNVLDVIDGHGRVLLYLGDPTGVYNMNAPLVYGGVGRTAPSVRAALAGQKPPPALDTDMHPGAAAGGYALRATVPLYDGARVIGAVVVGRQFDSGYASRIGNALNATVNLIAGTQRTGTTLLDHNGLPVIGPASPAVLARVGGDNPGIIHSKEDGRDVLSGLTPLPAAAGPPVAAVEVVSRLNPLYDVVTQLSLLLLALGAAVAVAGSALAFGIGRRLTARLLELEVAAAYVATQAGAESAHAVVATPLGDAHVAVAAPFGDVHAVVAAHGDDEVASLARSFGAMMRALDERMDANARLYAAARARVRELSGLAEIARLLTASSPLQQTLDELGAHVCRLVGGAAVAIVLHGEDAAPNVYGGTGLPEDYAAITNAAMATAAGSGFRTIPEIALRSGETAWRRVADIPDSDAALRAFAQGAGWGGTMAAPLRLRDRTIGALACYTATDAPPSASDLSLLTTIADQVAVVVENARLQVRARDLAALEERQRLARELHDSVSQALYGIALGARTARTLLDRDPAQAAAPLDYVLQLAGAGMAEMRALIFELRPESLESEGLVAAIAKQAASMRARYGIVVDAVTGEEPEAPYPVKEALYRIAQEALHNTVKHARARRVEVRLHRNAAGLALEVCDDGVGFDPDDAFPGRLGLHTMRERAVRLSGTLDVASAVGDGTRVRVKIPC